MKKKILFLFIILFAVTSVFAYNMSGKGDCSQASYQGRSYEMYLDYEITRLRNAMIEHAKKKGDDIYGIKELSKKETQLLELALEEHNLHKDDVYLVTIGIVSETVPGYVLMLLVRIDSVTNNGRYGYSWWSIVKGSPDKSK